MILQIVSQDAVKFCGQEFSAFCVYLALCDAWPLGVYNVTGRVCNGICGSHHPHTSLYDMQKSSFELIKKQNSVFIRNIA